MSIDSALRGCFIYVILCLFVHMFLCKIFQCIIIFHIILIIKCVRVIYIYKIIIIRNNIIKSRTSLNQNGQRSLLQRNKIYPNIQLLHTVQALFRHVSHHLVFQHTERRMTKGKKPTGVCDVKPQQTSVCNGQTVRCQDHSLNNKSLSRT